MIGFSIMMWFAGIILFITAIGLFKGNTSFIHGKVYETTADKIGYGKALGKVLLFMAIVISCCGGFVLHGTANEGIRNSIILIFISLIICCVITVQIQRKFRD